MFSKTINNSTLALVLLSTANEAAGFEATKGDGLNSAASCTQCLKSGYVYIYNGEANSADTSEHFLEVSQESTSKFKTISSLKGKCCKVSTAGVYTCTNDALEEENLRWEAVQFKGYEAGQYQAAYTLQIRQYWNMAKVQLKMTDDYSTLLTSQTWDNDRFQLVIGKLTQVYCNKVMNFPANDTRIYDKLVLIDLYYDKYNASTWWREFKKMIDTCYDPLVADSKKLTDATKILADWDPFIFYGWADTVLGAGKGKAIEAEVKLVEEYESANLRKKYEQRLIKAFGNREKVPTVGTVKVGETELKAIQAELVQYTFFYGKLDIRDLKQLRSQLEAIQRVEGEPRYQLYFAEMAAIKTNYLLASFEPAVKFKNLLLWTFWEQRQGAKDVDIAKRSLSKLTGTDKTTYKNNFIGQMESIRAGIIVGNTSTKFKDTLVALYYISEVGKTKYEKFLSLNTKSSVYNDDPTTRVKLLEENMKFEDPTYIDDALWELEFWQYWVDKKTATKTLKLKDNFAQLQDQGKTDAKQKTFYEKRLAELERAYVLQDLYAFDYISQITEDRIPDIYRSFWSNKSGATDAYKTKFQTLRQFYGIPWAKQFAAFYKTNTSFSAISAILDVWEFLKSDSNISKFARDEAAAIFRKSGGAKALSKVYMDAFIKKLTDGATANSADKVKKAAEFNKVIAQYKYEQEMKGLANIDKTAMELYEILGLPKSGVAMSSSDKTKYGITNANTLQLKLKLDGLNQGLKGLLYQNKLDIVPLLFKYCNAGISTYDDLMILKANVDEIKKRNPGQDRPINDLLFKPLRTLFNTDDWVQRIITASKYGLLVSWTTLKNMLNRYVFLFHDIEENDAKKVLYKPTYGTYVTLMDPLTTAYAAQKLAPTDKTKALKRSTFEAVSEEVDLFYFIVDFDNLPNCTSGTGCKDLTLYNYSQYQPATGPKFKKVATRANYVQVKKLAQKIYSKLEELKVLGKTDATKKALYDKYYKELLALYKTWFKANNNTFRVNLMTWYGKFFWAFYGFEKQYDALMKNLTAINTKQLDGNFVSFIMYQLGQIYDKYENAPDSAARAKLDTIEIPLAITYWYLNSGKYDAYSTITYAFDTLPNAGHTNQEVKLKFFKKLLIQSYKQKDLFLLKAGLEEVSDMYMSLYDPQYVQIFDKLDILMNKVERDGYRVIDLLKKLDVLYAYYVNHNDRVDMQQGKNSVDLWTTLKGINTGNVMTKTRETLKKMFVELSKKRYNKNTNCKQNDTTCADLYEKTLLPIFIKSLVTNVDDWVQRDASNIAKNIDLYERLLYIAEKVLPTKQEYERVFYVMTEDLIFRSYEKLNPGKSTQQENIWNSLRKKYGEDMIQTYIKNRFKINTDYKIYDASLRAWVERLDNFAKCTHNWDKTNPSSADCTLATKKAAVVTPVVGAVNYRGMLRSNEFASNDLAMAACPHDKTVCGTKNIVFKNEDSFDYKIKIEDMLGSSSCHWLIKAQCGLPAVEITDIESNLEKQLEVHYLEWQANGSNVEMDAFYKDYPAAYQASIFVPDAWNHYQGELGEVVFDITKYPKGISFQQKKAMLKVWRYVWASVIESEVNRLQDANDLYSWKIGKWQEVADKYDQGIKDIESFIESNDNQTPYVFYAQVYKGGEFGLKAKTMYEDLPEVPPLPLAPAQQLDISMADAVVVSGFGSLTSGMIKLRGMGGTTKSFGVFGQGRAANKGFTSKKEHPGVDGKMVCYDKYIALNMYPANRNFKQIMTGTYAQALTLTASSQKISKHALLPPVLPEPPKKLMKLSPGAQFFLDNGSAYLAAGFASAAFVAATLF